MGADFKPYLIQVLALVKKNWYRRNSGKRPFRQPWVVQIQFIIDRSGTVPKLVIATPSGSESLDKAAVAGIGASQPFPPFPKDFNGQQIRLSFVQDNSENTGTGMTQHHSAGAGEAEFRACSSITLTWQV